LDVETDKVCFAIDRAVPCGLIVNELVSNALKHAFPDGRQGRVRIVLRANGGQMMLLVEDDGIGLPKGLDYQSTPSLGLQLVNSLISQLDGTVELSDKEGTSFRIKLAGLSS
jgi:two-component sensor histidine kinase